MKHPLYRRVTALAVALCLLVLPALTLADTYLPDGPVTHVDFTTELKLHADGFPASAAHLRDWETFLNKLDLRGSMDALAMLTPESRVYLNAALRLNGKDQIPFVYDGYHSYRYLISPAFNNEVLFFQMHNFLEFMLKPYYYMELPTQYLGLLMYPEASYYIGDSYYTPVAEMLENARQEALDAQADAASGDAQAADAAAETPDAEAETPAAAGPTAANGLGAAVDGVKAASTGLGTPASETLTYTVPYEDLYELCETLDQVGSDQNDDLSRAYFYFTCLLTEMYASDMALDMLGNLETQLDALDPDQQGMLVIETPDSLSCKLGDTEVFSRHSDGKATNFHLDLPTTEGYTVLFDYAWTPDADGVGAALDANLTVTMDGQPALTLEAKGEGLPCEGDLSGKGKLTFKASGYTFTSEVPPVELDFDWVRDAATLPYTLDLNVDWIHPQTSKPAVSLHFNGAFKAEDKSVFVEGQYPQNDFFNLNETFLNEYKDRMTKTLALKLAPILLETPGGVIDDVFKFMDQTDLLVSLIE